MAAVDGADRVGFRICPGNPFNDLSDENPEETFVALLEGVRDMGLAYCHVIRLNSIPNAPDLDNVAIAAKAFGNPLIVNDSYKIDEAKSVVDSGVASAVAFARSFIGNPDLVRRLEQDLPLSRFNPKALYSMGPEGYSDYPTAD